jgi:hypothetical protein
MLLQTREVDAGRAAEGVGEGRAGILQSALTYSHQRPA